MRSGAETDAFDRGIRPLLEIVLPGRTREIAGFQADPGLRARIDELAFKSTEGLLTEPERAEYAGYVRANKFVAILQKKARELADIAE